MKLNLIIRYGTSMSVSILTCFLFCFSYSTSHAQTLSFVTVESTCESNGEIAVTCTGCPPDAEFQIFAGPICTAGNCPVDDSPEGTFASLPSGTYSVRAFDANGVLVEANIAVPGNYQEPIPDGDFVYACPGQMDAEINIEGVMNGLAPYEYRAFVGVVGDYPGAIGPTEAALPFSSATTFGGFGTGVHSYQVKDACGVIRTGELVISDAPPFSLALQIFCTDQDSCETGFRINRFSGGVSLNDPRLANYYPMDVIVINPDGTEDLAGVLPAPANSPTFPLETCGGIYQVRLETACGTSELTSFEPYYCVSQSLTYSEFCDVSTNTSRFNINYSQSDGVCVTNQVSTVHLCGEENSGNPPLFVGLIYDFDPPTSDSGTSYHVSTVNTCTGAIDEQCITPVTRVIRWRNMARCDDDPLIGSVQIQETSPAFVYEAPANYPNALPFALPRYGSYYYLLDVPVGDYVLGLDAGCGIDTFEITVSDVPFSIDLDSTEITCQTTTFFFTIDNPLFNTVPNGNLAIFSMGYTNSSNSWVPLTSNVFAFSGPLTQSIDNSLCVENLEAKIFPISGNREELTSCVIDLEGQCYQVPDGVSVIGLPCNDGIQSCDDGTQPYNILATAPEMNGLGPFTWEVFIGGTNTLFIPQVVTPDTFIVIEEVCEADLTLDIFVTDACGQQIMSEVGFGALTFDLLFDDMAEICNNDTLNLNEFVKPVVGGGTWMATNGGPAPVDGVVGPAPNVTGCFDYNYQLTPDNLPGICSDLDVPFELCFISSSPSVGCPDSLTVECDGMGNIMELEAWIASASGAGACGGMDSSSVTATLIMSVPGNGVASTDTYEFLADDGNGNTSVCTSVFITTDVAPPLAIGAMSNDTISCEDDFDLELADWLNSMVATDGCSMSPTIITEQMSVQETCTATEAYTSYVYSVVATDVAGNMSAVLTQTFVVVDDVPPVITPPMDLEIECGNENLSLIMAWLEDYTVVEACQGYTVTNDWNGMVPELCAAAEVPVVWTVTDDCGASSTATANISVIADTTAPEFQNCPSDMTVNVDVDLCGANVLYSEPVAMDCNGIMSVALDSGPASGTAFPIGQSTIVYVATDNCGNTATCSFNITVVDTDIPSISCPSNAVEQCTDDATCTWASTASINPVSMENCPNVEIIHSIVSADGSIDATDAAGLIAVGTLFPIGTNTVTYTITDEAGLSSTCSFEVNIEDCEAPMIECPENTTVECDGAGNVAELADFLAGAMAMDNCTEDANVIIDAIAFNTITTCGMSSTTTYQFVATDEAGNTSVCFADFVIEDTVAPTIATAAVDEIVECDGSGNVSAFLAWLASNGGITDAEVTETCGGFEWQNNFGEASFVMNDPCTGDVGTWEIDFWVVDDCGQESTPVTLSFTIEDTAPPTIVAPSAITIQCGDAANEGTVNNWLTNISANDLCSAVEVTNDYDVANLPTSCDQMITITWTATDECGNSATAESTIEMIDDEKPIVMIPPAPMSTVCGPTSMTDLDAWIANAGGTVVVDNCTTTITPVSELVYESGECTGSMISVYNFTYTDDCGNAITTSSFFELLDTVPPVLELVASDLNVMCDGAGNVGDLNGWLAVNGLAMASEECSSVTWSYNLISSINLCGDTGTDIYVFTASDDCGNMVSDTAEFTIMASEIMLSGGADYETECADSNAGNDDELVGWLNNNAGIIGENACGNLIWTNNFDAANWIDGCNDGRNIDVTFFATDDCGNMDSLMFNFSTSDNTAPEFINCPLAAYVVEVPLGSCEAYANFSLPIADDNCGTPTVVQTDMTGLSSGSLFPLGLTTLEFTATDDCGNTATCTVEVQVNDLNYELLTECPEDVMTVNDLGSCGAIVDSIGLVILNNICSITSDVEYEVRDSANQIVIAGTDDASGNFFPIGVNTLQYVITDQYGNVDSCTTIVTVQDIEAPVCTSDGTIAYAQGDTTINISDLDCGAVFDWTHPVYSDNCVVGTMDVMFDYVNDVTGASSTQTTTLLSLNGQIDADGTTISQLFEVGETTVSYVLTDAFGNISLCSFVVTVVANEAPEFNAGCEDVTINLDPGDCYASIYPPIDLSNTCGIDTVTYFANGEEIDLNQIPFGTTTIVIEATDIYGNVGSCSFDITVLEYTNTTTVLGCNNNLNISLGASCQAIVTPDMILEGGPYGCYDNYCMEITDADGNIVNNIFDLEDVGSTFTASIIDCNGDGNSCWGYITIENKLIPELACPADVTLSCNQDPNAIFPAGSPEAGELVYGSANLESCEVSAEITYQDAVMDYGECSDPRVEVIRTWTVEDAEGNSVSCDQRFDFLPFDPAMVDYPAEFILDQSLDCSEVASDPSLTEPQNTGYPTFSGEPIIGNNYCDIHLGYWDEVLVDVNCPSAYVIYRHWKIDNECLPIEDGVNPLEFIQRIKVKDTEAPEITQLEDVTINVDQWTCEGTYTLPTIDNSDDCSTVSVEWSASYGQIIGNQVTNLVKGESTIFVKATDGCGNQTFGSFTVTAVDLNPPTIISEVQHTVTLSQDGIAKVYAEDLDDGSYDGCGEIGFMVKRMDDGGACSPQDYFPPAGDDNTQFNEVVHFCCADVADEPVMVQFQVCDDADLDGVFGSEDDNCNLVMVEVFVQDKLAPQIICPGSVSISCIDMAGIDLTDTDLLDELFGTAVAASTCNVEVTQSAVGNELCGSGVVFRNFTATNSAGTTSCQQIITVTAGPDESLTCDRISFESISNSTYNWCAVNDNTNDPDDDLPALEVDCNGSLEIPAVIVDINGLCTEAGQQITVDTFDFAGGACKKFLIHYEVIDQCIFDENYVDPTTGEIDPFTSDNGYFELYLEVDAFDNEEPVPNCEDAEVVAQSCEGYDGAFTITGSDNCTDASFLGYQWRLDVDSDNTIDFPASGWFASNEVTPQVVGLAEFPIGQHTIFWIVSDGCGNDAVCSQIITVQGEDKEPTPYCYDGLSVAVMPTTGTVALWANDFDAGSFDNCGGELTLSMVPESVVDGMGGLEAYGQSFMHPNVTQQPNGDMGFEFDCSYIPNGITAIIEVRIYVTDADGNWDYCTASLRLDDNFDACDDLGSTITFESEGTLKTEFDAEIAEVDVTVEASFPEFPMTETFDGSYSFDLIQNIDYTIVPTKDHDYLNGITTLDIVMIQKHILGLEALDSSYKLIAADVNSDCSVTGIDIIQLRKLILGKYVNDELPDNDSWRFVESEYQFVNPNAPCNFAEVAEIFNLSTDVNNDFVGVKIGDVNGSAEASLVGGATSSTRANDSYRIRLVERQRGENSYVDFVATETSTLYGFQFDMNFIGNFEGIDSRALTINDEAVGFSTSNSCMLSYDIPVGISFEMDEVLFTVKLNTTNTRASENSISLNKVSFVDEAYVGEMLERKTIEFIHEGQSEKTLDVVLHQNEPNPFTDRTKISFDLPEAGIASLVIYDVDGTVLYSLEDQFSKGNNVVVVSRKDIRSSGVLYYKLKMGTSIATRKMIVLID